MTLTNLKGFYVKVVNFRLFTLTIGIVYAALFILSRLWFYLDYPIPGIYPDSASYYEPTQKILNSEFPKFNYSIPFDATDLNIESPYRCFSVECFWFLL